MQTKHRKLLTIVTEALLEQRMVRELERLGARGYTITDARGKGGRGIRDAGWESSGNIRIEVVCESATATAIAAHLQDQYYDNSAMILFIGDVEVLRPGKF